MVGIKPQCAIGLIYEQDVSVPQVSCVGFGKQADLIIALAKKNFIPLVKRPDLAERMLKLDPGQEIPEDLYRAIAAVLIAIES